MFLMRIWKLLLRTEKKYFLQKGETSSKSWEHIYDTKDLSWKHEDLSFIPTNSPGKIASHDSTRL